MANDIVTTARPSRTGPLVRELHHLARMGLMWAVLYGMFSRASRSACAADGNCISATLGPSPLVWLAMAAVLVVALGRLRRSDDSARADRILRWASWAIPLIPLVATVTTTWWFVTMPLDAFSVSGYPPWMDVQVERYASQTP